MGRRRRSAREAGRLRTRKPSEVAGAAARVDAQARERTRRVPRAISLIAVTDEVLERAAGLEPAALRSLDAVHPASALALEAALGSFLAYDARLQEAATAAGLAVRAPG